MKRLAKVCKKVAPVRWRRQNWGKLLSGVLIKLPQGKYNLLLFV